MPAPETNTRPSAVEYALAEAKLLHVCLRQYRAMAGDCTASINAADIADAPTCHPDDLLAAALKALADWIAVAEVTA